MLVIDSNGTDTRKRILTLDTARNGERTLRIIKPDHTSRLGGEVLADVVLSKADAAELKKNL